MSASSLRILNPISFTDPPGSSRRSSLCPLQRPIDEPQRLVVGLITAYDIMGEKPMRYLRAVPGQRHEVLVRDIMLKLGDWRVADVGDLERSTVASVSRHFDETLLTHIPVMEFNQDGRRQLRGLLSAAKVKRLLAKQG